MQVPSLLACGVTSAHSHHHLVIVWIKESSIVLTDVLEYVFDFHRAAGHVGKRIASRSSVNFVTILFKGSIRACSSLTRVLIWSSYFAALLSSAILLYSGETDS